MEPMTIGSPGGSPAPNTSHYLPSFLMGEPQIPPTPRSNTLSPNKSGGRSLSFANSPTNHNSPQDFNRTALGQKTLFGFQQQTPVVANYTGATLQSHSSLSGPPTQGLFEALRNENNQVDTPTRSNFQHLSQYGTPISQQGAGNQKCVQPQQQFNDSYLSPNSLNSRFNSPLPSPALEFRCDGPGVNAATSNSHLLQCSPLPRYTEFWVTVYGFPPSATTTILQHFAQCGTIVDKVFSNRNGNWVHLKYSSRLECDRALNYNEKILANNIMIGVTRCKDTNIIDKENVCQNNTQMKLRPLAQSTYKSPQSDCAVVGSPGVPQKTSGLMSKAIDIFFGW